MSTLKTMTKLDAINIMLLNCGIDTISSLIDDQDTDVSAALLTLDRISREVQAGGWKFNTEENYTLSRSVLNQEIKIPSNLLSFRLSPNSLRRNVTERGTRLYDLDAHSYKFNEDVTVTAIFFLDFDEIPSSARNYIALRASREFQNDTAPSEIGLQTAPVEEVRAYAQFIREQSLKDTVNLLRKRPGRPRQ